MAYTDINGSSVALSTRVKLVYSLYAVLSQDDSNRTERDLGYEMYDCSMASPTRDDGKWISFTWEGHICAAHGLGRVDELCFPVLSAEHGWMTTSTEDTWFICLLASCAEHFLFLALFFS